MIQKFEFEELDLKGAYKITPFLATDERGGILKDYNIDIFTANGIKHDLKETFYTITKKGVIRALHFQLKKPQAKLIRCISGHVYAVIVDLRKESKSFGQYVKVELSEENHNMLFIPNGFAHGFVALTDNVELIYKTGGEYEPKADRGVLWSDKDINVDWNIDFEPILSEKDKIQPKLKDINKEELL